jgi:E2/UBC family protein C/ThiF family protein
MALANYYTRAAVAAAQVIAGFDERAFRTALETTSVGVSFDHDAAHSREGQALLDLTVRLLARLYPTIGLQPAADVTEHAEHLDRLAKAINPEITITEKANIGIAIGPNAPAFEQTIFAGSSGWTAHISGKSAQTIGDSAIPFGAGAAACLAAAALFRIAVLNDADSTQAEVVFSCLDGVHAVPTPSVPREAWHLHEPVVLVGCGAIGQAAVWMLGRSPLRCDLFLVDGEQIDLSNLQRYVLTTYRDEDAVKSTLAADHLSGSVTPRPYHGDWASFLAAHGHHWPIVMTGLDSAQHRRAVQASLPRWIANAWTQPGDLGVSTHEFLSGACLACLYLPTGSERNEDVIVAEALGVSDRAADVRTLLHSAMPVPAELLDAIAAGLAVSRDALDPFQGQPIRKLYVEGVCGGAVLPLGAAGTPRQEVHVPLAHQSALAGVLLAARLVRLAAGADSGRTEVTRLDILRDPGQQPTQYALKDPRGICICQDSDYQAVYAQKWTPAPESKSPDPEIRL